jgi:hypothetical protein
MGRDTQSLLILVVLVLILCTILHPSLIFTHIFFFDPILTSTFPSSHAAAKTLKTASVMVIGLVNPAEKA